MIGVCERATAQRKEFLTSTERPPRSTIHLASIPEEIKDAHRWVCLGSAEG